MDGSRKCQCPKCQPTVKPCGRLYREDLKSHERLRYSDPKFWCQCGAWKYDDAPSCEDCWRDQEGYADR